MASFDAEISKKKGALGRGLASLIPEAEGAKPAQKEFFQCDIEKIVPNTYQPRKIFEKEALEDLVASVKEHGVIQPLVVRRHHGQYELVAGERRWRAAQKAGLKQVPVVVRDVSDDQNSLEMAIVENVQRADLNCIEEAIAYQQLADEFQLSQEDIAKKVGKSRATIANLVRLLKLPSAIREDITSNKMTMGHARALLSLDLAEDQLTIREEILKKNLSVRETEKRVNEIQKSKKKGGAKKGKEMDPNLQALCDKLRRHYGTKVSLMGSEKSGLLQFSYSSKEDLTRLSEALLLNFDS